MSRLLWMLAGLVGGVSIARNAPAMPAPAGAAVILCGIVACGVCWWAAYRGKSVAVATAVATAVAAAEARADAAAAAVATGGSVQVLNLPYASDRDAVLAGWSDRPTVPGLPEGAPVAGALPGGHDLAFDRDTARALGMALADDDAV